MALERMGREEFDVLVIGGGITGAGVVLDAASRGLRTALVERADFASGTSSRSSKFVHGGLRYVRQRQYRLVAESLLEQRRLLRNAPHLVRPLPVLLPVGGSRCRRSTYAALLSVHDLAGGTGVSRRAEHGVVFHEAQVDDARLTVAVLRTAALDHGAVVANYCPVEGLEHDGRGRVRAAVLAGGTTVSARAVVNATGVWSDLVAGLDGPGERRLRPAKGIHVVVGRARLPISTAQVIPGAGEDRWLFVAPWGDRVIVGTTDSDYDGPLDAPECSGADVAGLLEEVNASLEDPLTERDVLGSWAGLRPLIRGGDGSTTADLSRRHEVSVGPSGLVTVVGGKLTTYRRMAADAVDRLDLPALPSSATRRLALIGAGPRPPGLSDHLWARYGTDAPAILALSRAEPHLAAPLVPGLPYLAAEAIWAVRAEMARTLDDVLSRRLRALILDRAGTIRAAPAVAGLLAPEMGWSADDVAREVAALSERAR
jgi:glycerol-3-phosphate dehydrogenase